MTNETIKEDHRSVSTVNSESYEKWGYQVKIYHVRYRVENNECGGKDEEQAARPPSPPER